MHPSASALTFATPVRGPQFHAHANPPVLVLLGVVAPSTMDRGRTDVHKSSRA